MRRALCVACLLVLVSAPAAFADSSVLPNDGLLPWTDPAHHSPLEQLATTVASHIAGRTVSVQCDGQTDWNTLATQAGFDPSYELGFVPFRYWLSTGTIADGGDIAFLSPTVCWNLEQFGVASVKPTKCQPPVSQTTTRTVKQRYRATVRRKVKGHWVKRSVWKTRLVQQAVTTQTAGPPVPCYTGGGGTAMSEPSSYWQTYWNDAEALLVLAHESIHLQQDVVGASVDAILPTSETDANCYGLQSVPYVAEQFGATPDDAQAIAEYAYERIYPGYQGVTNNGSPYWSASCVANGPLDLTPGDGVWP